MSLKFCQGSQCHMYMTKDRIKGQKGNKTYQTRRRSSFYYGNGNFCSWKCLNDWFTDLGDRAIDYFGRTVEPKILTEENAWRKTFSWDHGYNVRSYVYRNSLTDEERPLTEQQYNDNNYTLNER